MLRESLSIDILTTDLRRLTGETAWFVHSSAGAGTCPASTRAPPSVGQAKHRSWESTALHDAEELFLVDLAIAIAIGLINHLLELLIGHVLSKLLGDALQVLERDLAGLVVVEEAEHLDDLLTRVAVSHAGGHHVEELVEVDGAGAILVDVVDHTTDLVFLGVEAEGAHGDLELLGVNGAGAIGVEEVECLTDLLDLVVGESLCLGWCAARHFCFV